MAHEPKWQLAPDMVDELTGRGITPPPALGDAASGDVTGLRCGLEEDGLERGRSPGVERLGTMRFDVRRPVRDAEPNRLEWRPCRL